MVQKPRHIQIKKPEDVMGYVQTLINRIRREGKEMEELGKITYLLNTWLASFKIHVEFSDLKQIKEDLARLEQEVKGRRK
jgi:hypothetical protein